MDASQSTVIVRPRVPPVRTPRSSATRRRDTPCQDHSTAHGASRPAERWVCSAEDEQFVHMLRAFRRHGGMAREPEAIRVRIAAGLDAMTAARSAVRFDWANAEWLPWFQFDPKSGFLHPGVSLVVSELAPAFDGWHTALWFAQPNSWLDGSAPVDVFQDAPEAVHQAARADRFIAIG